MKKFFNSNDLQRLDTWVDSHVITKFLTSRVALAFFYGIYLFLYEIKFFRESPATVMHILLIGWASFLICYDLVVRKVWRRMPFLLTIVLFLAAVAITLISTIEAGIVGNIKAFVMIALPLFAFYPLCLESDKRIKQKSLLIALSGASVIIFVASVIALCMYFVRYSNTVTLFGVEGLLGIEYYEPGDPTSALILNGIYEDTNHTAIYCAVFCAYSVVLFAACHNGIFSHKWLNILGKVYAVANICVQLCYFPFANSRGAWICLLIAIFIAAFLYCYCNRITVKAVLLRGLLALLCAGMCTAAVWGGLMGIRSGVSALSFVYYDNFVGEVEDTDVENGEQSENKNEQVHSDSFTKPSTGGGSGRIDIWKDTLKLFVKSPIIGIGSANNEYYAKKYDIAMGTLGSGKAVHNSYLDMLLNYGVFGTAILMIFWALCLVRVIKVALGGKRRNGIDFYLAMFSVLIISGAAVLLSCVFIGTTAMYFLMLIMTGYVVSGYAKPKLAENC